MRRAVEWMSYGTCIQRNMYSNENEQITATSNNMYAQIKCWVKTARHRRILTAKLFKDAYIGTKTIMKSQKIITTKYRIVTFGKEKQLWSERDI